MMLVVGRGQLEVLQVSSLLVAMKGIHKYQALYLQIPIVLVLEGGLLLKGTAMQRIPKSGEVINNDYGEYH